MALRDALQRVALDSPSYGRPRMTRELVRRGRAVRVSTPSLAEMCSRRF
jgi:hypothetical protein